MAYRILIVDDDIELLKMLKNYFEIKRYDVMMAEDGTDALEKIHKKPDIILLDINMPKIDGLEVCRRIRGKNNLSHYLPDGKSGGAGQGKRAFYPVGMTIY